MFCPQCGKENVDEAQFCVQCGNALKQADTAPAQPQQQTASAPVPPPAPSQQPQQPQQPVYQQPAVPVQPQPVPAQAATYPMTKQDETLRLINFILCILSCYRHLLGGYSAGMGNSHDRTQLEHLQGHQAQHHRLWCMHPDLR